jgi:hypothetical protein
MELFNTLVLMAFMLVEMQLKCFVCLMLVNKVKTDLLAQLHDQLVVLHYK